MATTATNGRRWTAPRALMIARKAAERAERAANIVERASAEIGVISVREAPFWYRLPETGNLVWANFVFNVAGNGDTYRVEIKAAIRKSEHYGLSDFSGVAYWGFTCQCPDEWGRMMTGECKHITACKAVALEAIASHFLGS